MNWLVTEIFSEGNEGYDISCNSIPVSLNRV